jgi:hypothetical protein
MQKREMLQWNDTFGKSIAKPINTFGKSIAKPINTFGKSIFLLHFS